MQGARHAWRAGLCVAAALAAMPVFAADPCSSFTWDVSRERSLFAGNATSVPAGKDSATAPALAAGKLVLLQLRPTGEVTFVAAPGRKNATDGGYAGLAALDIVTAGTYRIALDAPLWIDVVADGGLVSSTGHQGAPGCSPHKVVEFEFPVPRRLMLQFSGGGDPSVRVTVTAVER
jgi:hypothetical protein